MKVRRGHARSQIPDRHPYHADNRKPAEMGKSLQPGTDDDQHTDKANTDRDHAADPKPLTKEQSRHQGQQ